MILSFKKEITVNICSVFGQNAMQYVISWHILFLSSGCGKALYRNICSCIFLSCVYLFIYSFCFLYIRLRWHFLMLIFFMVIILHILGDIREFHNFWNKMSKYTSRTGNNRVMKKYISLKVKKLYFKIWNH